jgi:hypothetical protein
MAGHRRRLPWSWHFEADFPGDRFAPENQDPTNLVALGTDQIGSLMTILIPAVKHEMQIAAQALGLDSKELP